MRWTIDQFKAGNIRKMIERAGYPTVANDVDENLLQSMMPEIERRAFELVAENKGTQKPLMTRRRQRPVD
ncbi:MAG: hypothetical protein CM1200mP27_07390 [Chloroflexota bacterium]|nr:MAG: hypothetical protein CM1200mP27_07390 [Chloroflexota bacterium]